MTALREEIAVCCKKLRLRQLTDHIDSIETQDREQFLLELLQKEVRNRETSRIDRSIKQAGFYTRKLLDDFIFDEVSLPGSLTVAQLTGLQFIEDRQNLILYGNVGTGKTHLATALGIKACREGKRVAFWRTAALVNHLTRLAEGGEQESFLQKLEKLDLLICDEWGYVPLHRDGARLLFQVISLCYEKKSMILTTNVEFSKWANIFFDEMMTTAIIDRLVHHSHLIMFEGESRRVMNSLMRN